VISRDGSMSSGLPAVTLVMTTYFPDKRRKKVAEKTLRSWQRHLKYQGELRLHVADDGSKFSFRPEHYWRGEISRSYQFRKGVGASLNRGFRQGFEVSPLVLYAVDDWSLVWPLDITTWAQVLMARSDVGMVRLGPPHPNIRGEVQVYSEDWRSWGLRLERYAYAFGHRPALYHRRMIDAYGWFEESVTALECEKIYAERFARTKGPDIILSLSSPWFHMPEESLSAVLPQEE
jgi:hypothetical protein